MNILMLLKPKAVIDYAYEDFTIRQAIEKMRNHGFTAIPVIKRSGEFVKTLAEGDILWFMLANNITDVKELERYSVSSIPRRVINKPVSVSSTIEDLILLSINQNFVPVIDDRNKFIGIVTRSDILQHCHAAAGGASEENQNADKIFAEESAETALSR